MRIMQRVHVLLDAGSSGSLRARMRHLYRALTIVGGALVVAAAAPSVAAAQTGKITGVVTDAGTGRGVEGVQVVLQGTGRGAVTGGNGRYFILSVPPGAYTVTARRIGYQAAERRGIQLGIDQTYEANFALTSSAGQLTAVKVEVERTPLIQPGTTGSRSAISAEEIEALPVTGIAGVLALQLGYLSVPTENQDVTSYADERRGVNVSRVRGGRGSETQTLIDGIPINNFVLGGPAFDITNEAVQQIGYERGGFEAQYGNAMSGIINYATKEGSATLRGALNYQTSKLAGAMGSGADRARGSDFMQGYLSGPVPGTGQKMRWMVAGRQNTGAASALEFDDIVFNPFSNVADNRGQTASISDFFAGWRAVGFNAQRDIFAKLTTYFTPSMKLNLGYIDYVSQSQYYNPAFVMAGYDVTQACKDAYPNKADYCDLQYASGRPQRFEDLLVTANGNLRAVQEYTIQGSTRNNRDFAWANFSHTIGRTNYQIRGGRLYTAREACNYLTGLCLGDKIRNFTTAQDWALGQFTPYSRHGAPYVNPGAATENFAGGDTNTVYSLRADVQSQVTDHHNLQTGVFFQRHDIRFYEATNVTKPLDLNTVANFVYGGSPWDAAIYLQDRIEYDFLTLKLGARFDYTRADGQFFNNPLDPTNGTTAAEVCNGTAFGGQPFSLDAGEGRTVRGLAACNADPVLRDSATRIAARDDFGKAPVRKQFSPRIGVQFPLSTRSSFFANWGIYSQNPTYNAMYSGTGIGRVADTTIVDTRGITGLDSTGAVKTYGAGATLEGTPYGPNFRQNNGQVPAIGNPQLAIERTSAYEMGFQSELGQNYSLQVTGFAKDQSGLTGYRNGGVLTNGTRLLDFGQTYNPAGTGLVYRVLVNTDYQTVRGLELILRRKLANYWAFSAQYGYQQVSTSSAPPELELQKIIEGDTLNLRREIRSEIDQPHLFTGVLRVEFAERVPEFRYSGALKNTRFALTTRAASGLPYTPTLTFTGAPQDRLERNSGTGPATWTLDLRLEKGWRTANLLYSGFLSVGNLLDRKNCVQVFSSTGQCDSGALAAARLQVGGRQGGGEPVLSQTGGSSTLYDRPQMYASRRSINAGVRVSF